jgi:two-component system chemotaxis response regulator CheY
MSPKVLVVDDSQLLHRMYDMVLSKNSRYLVLHAMNGLEAMSVLAQNPDTKAVLLDINMPAMNGIEFLEKLSPTLRSVPVIIVSTEGEEADVLRGLEAGACAYLKKPFQPNDLLHAVEAVSKT